MELEGGDLLSRLGGGAREEAGHKKIHGVPNPIPAQNTVRRSQQSHNHAAGQTAFEPGGNRIDLERQRSAMEIRDARESANFLPGRQNRGRFWLDWYPFM